MASHSRLNRRLVLPFALALVLAGEVTGLALAVRLQPLTAASVIDTRSGPSASAARDHVPGATSIPSRSAEPAIRTESAYGAWLDRSSPRSRRPPHQSGPPRSPRAARRRRRPHPSTAGAITSGSRRSGSIARSRPSRARAHAPRTTTSTVGAVPAPITSTCSATPTASSSRSTTRMSAAA